MNYEYSEDNLIEQTAIELFHNRLGWDTAIAYNKETFGEDSTLSRLTRQEIILKRNFFDKIKQFNPDLPQQAYTQAYEKLLEESSIKTLGELNQEKYFLLRDGVPVDYTNNKGELIKNKFIKVFDCENADNSHFLAVRQLWIEGQRISHI